MTIHAVEQAIKIEYQSADAPHVMILPINTLVGIGDDESDTLVNNWDATTQDIGGMVSALRAVLVPFFPATVNLLRATLLVTDPEDEALVPAFSWALSGGEGTALTPGWSKAVEWTISFRSEDNNVSKLVLLDAASFDNFSKITDLTGETALAALIAEWTDTANAWAARDNTRPATWTQATRTLNEKLRKAYRMT